MSKAENSVQVRTKQQFIKVIFELLDGNDAIEWENETAYSFLQALAAWLNDSDGYYKNKNIEMDTEIASWQLFAEALHAASIYE